MSEGQMQREQSCIYLTHITKHDWNMGSGHIHGSWSGSAHNAETPVNSLRKLSGSILISCLMRKVCHALWKILGKPYRFLKISFSFPSFLTLLRGAQCHCSEMDERETKRCKCELAWINACLTAARRSACRKHANTWEVQTKAQHQGTPGQLD